MPSIATNIAANSTLRYLNMNSANQTDTLAKIASGSRIIRASDDAAGLAVATKLSATSVTLGQAATNAAHGISILETADGGLSNISDILVRMKTLTAQSLSGAVTNTERAFVDAEFQSLIAEIDSIATSTQFNGESLLDGNTDWSDGTGVNFLLGTSTTNDTLTINLTDVSADNLGGDLTGLDVVDQTNAAAAASALETAIGEIAEARATVGAAMSRFEFRANNIDVSNENVDAAKSAIADADVAEEQATLSSYEVLTNAAISALSKANAMPQQLLSLFQ
ncbi:flagellin [Aestuariispira insulae]|uniref:Flagellin n=1 Tax=Aestuariispira insulae TaxID=1461337 RepID=A0A3D9H5S4_9PROT|nr:flagellin [Aestuariispira insulae]RED44802.1 flagellin [Aestuariispira insulae]